MNKALITFAMVSLVSANKERMNKEFNNTVNFDFAGIKYDRNMVNGGNRTTLEENLSAGNTSLSLDAFSKRPQ